MTFEPKIFGEGANNPYFCLKIKDYGRGYGSFQEEDV